MTEREMLIAAVAEYNRLLDVIEGDDTYAAIDAENDLEELLRQYPAIEDYDSKGNYIGEVRNENGWTP